MVSRSRLFDYKSDFWLSDRSETLSDQAPRHRIYNAFGLYIYPVWAFSISLAATLEITIVFFSWSYLDVSVHFVRLNSLFIQLLICWHYPTWVFPFRYPRIKACLAAPRGFSQLSTSFIASRYQGIHRLPLLTWPQLKCCGQVSRPVSTN